MTREIKIIPVLNGFVCHVGCQTVVFESREYLLDALRRYMENPQALEKSFLASAVNPDLKRDDGPCIASEPGLREPRARVGSAPPSQDFVPPAPTAPIGEPGYPRR
jgi:hypothetical protein